MRLWQARKEKSQKIRKVEGRILYGRDGFAVQRYIVVVGRDRERDGGRERGRLQEVER